MLMKVNYPCKGIFKLFKKVNEMNTSIKTIKKVALVFVMFLASASAYSQLVFNAQVRPRAEFRNGYGTLSDSTTTPGFAISQRTRFDLSYNRDKVQIVMSLQDVRVWGDVKQLNSVDKNGSTIHQAWGQYQISDEFAVRAGRQELIYDNHRMFGNVGWAQQARSHDLAMVKYTKNKLKVDLGLAFNQDAISNFGTDYTTGGNYKTMQYVWAHNDWENLGASFLALNTGLQYIDIVNADNNEVRYNQTFGTYLNYTVKDIKLFGTFYYQMGKDEANRDLGGFLAGIDAKWNPKSKKIFAGVGFEMQSGNDYNWKSTADSTTNKAFFPLYGTNHKFNGYMDYFYVGNHKNNVGLTDLNATLGYKINKSKVVATFHYFMSSGAMITPTETLSSGLGSEIDLVYILPLGKDANLKVGYSQMFATESMAVLKGNTNDGANTANNWAWVMLTFKPQLFKHDYKTASPVVQ